jgi:hypothetical protein
VVPPKIIVGTVPEYAEWEAKARRFLRESGGDPASLERVAATFNYARNRIILFRLADPGRELSVAETLSHEFLHSLLEQLGERWAARALDLVARPALDGLRTGGV